MNKANNAHIVTSYSNELNSLSEDILLMGGIAEHMLRDAIKAVFNSDEALSKDVISRDLELDQIEHELGRKVVRMLALRQPLAADLRGALAALKTAHNLERVGDLAKSTARRRGDPRAKLPLTLCNGIERMGEQISGRLHNILDAYAMGDKDKAVLVWESDDEIDMLHNSLFREILMAMQEDQDHIKLGTNLLFIVKNFERIGDHCTNIAEEIYYRETGDILVRDRGEPKPS